MMVLSLSGGAVQNLVFFCLASSDDDVFDEPVDFALEILAASFHHRAVLAIN